VVWANPADGLYSRYGAGTRISQTGNLKFNADEVPLRAQLMF